MHRSEKNYSSFFVKSVVNELKSLGVKCPKDKQTKKLHTQKRCIFGVPLEILDQCDVILANGSVAQIPKFIADACSFILENVKTEGIFRKGGSALRQKEIRSALQDGLPLGKNHHVIDVASVVKYFFRELSEPLIPTSMHQPLLVSYFSSENVKAVMLVCLLLQPIVRNTLSFFMQFLHTVSINAQFNKMSVENLAIVLTPCLMPYAYMTSPRFRNHVKLIQFLIENSKSIGIIPDCIRNQIKINRNDDLTMKDKQKRKKRPSDVFNGLRRMVQSVRESEENLRSNISLDNLMSMSGKQALLHRTPCLNGRSERKLTDIDCLSSKKREQKKCRLYLSAAKHQITATAKSKSPTKMRWSFVTQSNEGRCHTFEEEANAVSESTSNLQVLENISESKNDSIPKTQVNRQHANMTNSDTYTFKSTALSDYESIKNRVTSIEKRLSIEIDKLNQTFLADSAVRADLVFSKYDQMAQETAAFLSPTVNKLTSRLSRELKLRQSVDKSICRSPSARKIGIIRRRSQGPSRPLVSLSNAKEKISAHLTPAKNLKTSKINSKKATQLGTILYEMTPPLKHNKPSTVVIHSEMHPTFRYQKRGEEECTSPNLVFQKLAAKNSLKLPMHETKRLVSNRQQFVTPKRYSLQGENSFQFSCTGESILPPKLFSKTQFHTPTNALKSALNEHENNGRASVARLRVLNAGAVTAKARLFDNLDNVFTKRQRCLWSRNEE